MSIDGDHDRQPDRRFRGRHGHHEEDDDLAVPSQLLGERHEREIHGVEHELDAHEDHDRVPPQQHARDAEAEQDRRDRQGLSQHQIRRLASTIAPTMAANSRTEVSSNGTR